MPSSRSGTKLFIAVAALGGSLLLAHPYRLQRTDSPCPVTPAAEHVVLRETRAPSDTEIVYPDAPTAEIQRTLLAPPPQETSQASDVKEPLGRLAPPPPMARSYPGTSAIDPEFAVLGYGLDETVTRRTKQRTHVVRDGDTLPSLAQRYLGDRARWREIYELNRDTISNPELLPLSARLLIPSKSPVTESGRSDEQPAKEVVQNSLAPFTP